MTGRLCCDLEACRAHDEDARVFGLNLRRPGRFVPPAPLATSGGIKKNMLVRLGASMGTSIIAYIRDATGSYDVALLCLLALGTASSLIMWQLGKTRRFAIDTGI